MHTLLALILHEAIYLEGMRGNHPSKGVIPIDVSMDLPPCTAVIEAPAPGQ